MRFVQGVPARMPDRCRYGEDEDRGAGSACGPARRGTAGPSGGRSCLAMRGSARLAWLANARNRSPALRRLGSARAARGGRTLPEWSHDSVPRPEARSASPTGGRAALCSCWPTPSIVTLNRRTCAPHCACWRAAGYGDGDRSSGRRAVCCGRTFLAAGGSTRPAHEAAAHAGHALAGDMPVLGLEPSCCSLCVMNSARCCLAPMPMRWPEGDAAVGVPGQRATDADAETGRLDWRMCTGTVIRNRLARFPMLWPRCSVPELVVKPIASSCCGMAGSFGYQTETQDISRAMAEASAAGSAGSPSRISSWPTAHRAGTESAIWPDAKRSTRSACWIGR